MEIKKIHTLFLLRIILSLSFIQPHVEAFTVQFHVQFFMNHDTTNPSLFHNGSEYYLRFMNDTQTRLNAVNWTIATKNFTTNYNRHTFAGLLRIDPYGKDFVRVVVLANFVYNVLVVGVRTDMEHVIAMHVRDHTVFREFRGNKYDIDVVKHTGNGYDCTRSVFLGVEWPNEHKKHNVTVLCPNGQYSADRFILRQCLPTGYENSVDDSRCFGQSPEDQSVSRDQNVSRLRDHLKDKTANHGDASGRLSDNELAQAINTLAALTSEDENPGVWDKQITTELLSIADIILQQGHMPPGNEFNLAKQVRDAIESLAKNQLLSTDNFEFHSNQISMIVVNIVIQNHKNRNLITSRKNGTLQLVLVKHENIGSSTEEHLITLSSRVMNALSTDLNVKRLAVYVLTNGSIFPSKEKVESEIFSVTFLNHTDEMELIDNAILRFDTQTEHETENMKCVFWDKDLHSGLGDWSSSGCFLKDRGVCSCSHLSSFALMNMKGLGDKHMDRLNMISMVGCFVSSVSLFFTAFTYTVFKRLRSEIPSRIITYISITFLLMNLLYVGNQLMLYAIGVDEVMKNRETMIVCRAVAVLLHFFLLSSLTWMGMNGFYMYKVMTQVFGVFDEIMPKLIAFAYGVPFLVVLITAGINVNQHYGLIQDSVCWLKEEAWIVSFMMPVIFIMMFNIYTFIIVLMKLQRVSKTEVRRSSVTIVTRQLKGAVSLTSVLGLTWVFGFLAHGRGKVLFAYLFVISNSFLGLFIFVFYCLMKQEVRWYWVRWWDDIETSVIGTRQTLAPTISVAPTSTIQVNANDGASKTAESLIGDDVVGYYLRKKSSSIDGNKSTAV